MALLDTLESLPIIGYLICLIQQIWINVYFFSNMFIWMFTMELFNKHVDLILSDFSNFDGRTAVITGGTRGIGQVIVKKLLQINMKLIIGCRDIKDGEKLLNSLRKEGVKTGSAIFLPLDLTSLDSVRKFSQQIIALDKPIDLLINNAGIMAVPYKETMDGFESQFHVNFLSHFLLTNLLLPTMVKTANETQQIGRVVNVNAGLMYHAKLNLDDIQSKKHYNPFMAYSNSKLLQLITSRHLDTKLKNAGVTNITTNSLHPGVIATDLVSHKIGTFVKPIIKGIYMTPEQGADYVLYMALSSNVEKKSGEYFNHRNMCTKSNPYFTSKIQNKVWEIACELSGFEPKFNFSNTKTQ